jgi:hypothetical protein
MFNIFTIHGDANIQRFSGANSVWCDLTACGSKSLWIMWFQTYGTFCVTEILACTYLQMILLTKSMQCILRATIQFIHLAIVKYIRVFTYIRVYIYIYIYLKSSSHTLIRKFYFKCFRTYMCMYVYIYIYICFVKMFIVR